MYENIKEPKFKIGDVVIDAINEQCPVYIIKDIITLIDGHDIAGYSYEVAPFGSPDESITITEDTTDLVLEYHDTNWEEYFTELCNNEMYDSIYMEGVKNHMIEAGIDLTVNNPKDYIYFQEMAGRISKDKTGKCNLIIAVGDGERTVPHFHVFRSEEDLHKWRNGACLFFTKNRYYDHSGNTETLTKKELEQVVARLKEIHPKLKVLNWEYLVSLWNDNNDRYEIPDDTPMPDYDYKTITRYKD